MSKSFKPQRKQTSFELLPFKKKKKSQEMRERHEGLKDLVILAISAYPCFSGSILESDIPSEYSCCHLVSQLTGSSSRRISINHSFKTNSKLLVL